MYKLTWPLYLLISLAAQAQDSPAPFQSVVIPNDIIICYGSEESAHTSIPPPDAYMAARRAGAEARVGNSTFEVRYTNFPEDAKKAFRKATDIWSSLLTSNVTIKVEAEWQDKGNNNVYASCRPYTVYRNFSGAPYEEVYYPAALANRLANTDLNGAEAEISMSVNSRISWHYDPDTAPPSGKVDLVTTILHEIGHGLGIFSAYHATGGSGQIYEVYEGKPLPYDYFLESGTTFTPLRLYTPPSGDIATMLTSESLYFKSPVVAKRFNRLGGKVFAPDDFRPGSSIVHNDEDEYPAGNANSLMTPYTGRAERILDPGPITMGELIDMGWGNPILTHTKVTNKYSRARDIEVVCKLDTANSPYPILLPLKVYYIKNSGEPESIDMTATGNPNEYKATIPRPSATDADTVKYAYYIYVYDKISHIFTWPGKKVNLGQNGTEQVYYKFKVVAPIRPPIVYHTPLTRVKNTAAGMEITAAFKHEYGIENGFVDWKVNDNAQTRVAFEHVSDSTYKATLPFTGLNLTGTETIRYRLSATDASHQTTSMPTADTYYQVTVFGLKPAQEVYANNFDNQNSENDFWGDFTISKPANFNNAAIQSPHPYKSAETGKTIDYTYELLIPIKVKEGRGIITFDEVVLVEPGNEGAVFGSPNFNDYVVLEGSADKGSTWIALADGWDSGDKDNWREAWNNQKGANAAKEGNPNLYHKRTLNLLDRFKADDEVALRFRLFSNERTAGWGWAIDNLAIQLQDGILHNHLDYVMAGTEAVGLRVQALDANSIQSFSFKVKLNDREETTHSIDLSNKSHNVYQIELPYSKGTLKKDDHIDYRIEVTNSVNSTTSLPATGYYRIKVLDLSEQVINYSDITTDKFFGNFITATPTTIETEHPYSVGFGTDYQSDFSAILSKPIKLDAKRPNFTFKEKLLLGENDHVHVEGSKDGISWKSLSGKYGKAATDRRTVSFFKDNEFKEGDVILLRFRLTSDKTGTGWGWEISDLQFKEVVATADNAIILHNHLDYVMAGTEVVRLQVQALDANAIQSLSFKIKLNEQEETTHSVDLSDKSQNVYQIELPYPKGALNKGDHIDYRIEAANSLNFTTLPATGYYRIKVLDLSEPINYSDITTDKFFGNFITATQTTIETAHPYSAGFGTDYKSDFSAILSKPLTLDAKRSDFTFKEKLLLGENDYVQVEGSKDGISWKSLSDKYTAAATDRHTISFFKDNEFKAGDVILLRFRMTSDKTGTGWGWEISDLQFPENTLTAIEEKKEFSLFPNPVKKGDITVQVNAVNDFTAEINDIYGRQIFFRPYSGGTKEIKLPTNNLSPGLYILSLREGGKRQTLRFVKL